MSHLDAVSDKPPKLSEADCDSFRRLPCSFNDMVRAIYRAGFDAAAARGAGKGDLAIQWPKARDVGRLHDMSPNGHLRVGLDDDNDVYVEVFNDQTESFASVEFCNPGGSGGGRSTRTRLALIALMVAIEADNADRPDLDWWARRMGPTNGRVA